MAADASVARRVPVTFSSWREAVEGLRAVARRLPTLVRVYRRGTIDRALRERVMIAVSEVNACARCTAVHHRWALRAGVTVAELEAIGLSDLARLDSRSRAGIVYATELATTRFRAPVDPDVMSAVRADLSASDLRAIEAVSRLIAFANLTTNASRRR